MAEQKVASWYWIVTAALTPFVLVATILWAYYTHEVQSNRAEGQRLVSKLEQDHAEFNPLLTHMKETAELIVGDEMGDPLKDADAMTDRVSRPQYFMGEERTQPPEKQSPLLRAYIDAESRFYGAAAGDRGYVHEYVAARDWLRQFENTLRRYLAVKAYQHYTVKTIDIGGETAVVTSGDLTRQYDPSDGRFLPPVSAVEDAERKAESGAEPADETMRKPTRITLELVFRKQVQLIRDLVAANHHQYALLYSGVSGEIKDAEGRSIYVGFEGEERRKNAWIRKLGDKEHEIDQMRGDGDRALDESYGFADDAFNETNAKGINLQQMVVAAEGRIEDLQSRFESQKTAHEQDKQNYDEMIRNLPRIKSLIKLEQAAADGEVTYSDYGRGVCHINLGSADGVITGQRFEIWRMHGFERDEFVGVIELVRTLNAHFSLCTVLSLTDEDDPVRKGDSLISHLWHNGDFRTVALHGNFEPPNQTYSKERLTKLLEQKGVRVVDKVQPGVDMVILGSGLLGDEWYRRARSDLRFETLRESEIRLYVDPR